MVVNCGVESVSFLNRIPSSAHLHVMIILQVLRVVKISLIRTCNMSPPVAKSSNCEVSRSHPLGRKIVDVLDNNPIV